MIQRQATIFLLASLMTSMVTCQTYQDSRDWAIDKRSKSLPIVNVLELKSDELDHINELQAARCASFYQWKMLFQVAEIEDASSMCRVPCDFLDVLRQCLCGQDSKAVGLGLASYIRRSSAPALDASSSSSGFPRY